MTRVITVGAAQMGPIGKDEPRTVVVERLRALHAQSEQRDHKDRQPLEQVKRDRRGRTDRMCHGRPRNMGQSTDKG